MKVLLLFFAVGSVLDGQALAQDVGRFEFGGRVDAGDFGSIDDDTRVRAVVGAELCGLCSGKRAID